MTGEARDDRKRESELVGQTGPRSKRQKRRNKKEPGYESSAGSFRFSHEPGVTPEE